MKRSKGYNCSTRKLFRKSSREKGIKSLRYLFHKFKIGDQVNIIINSHFQKGRPHRRYHATSGIVKRSQGKAYVIEVTKHNKQIEIISRPEHLRLAN